MMFYHTTLRNVGLYTSISFAALGYSRFYRGKTIIYSAGLVLISMAFLIIAAILNWLLSKTLENYLLEEKYKEVHTWEHISKVIMILHVFLLIFAIMTLNRLFTGNAFK